MNRSMTAELLKIRTTRGARWMMAGIPVVVAVTVASTIATAGRESYPLDTVEGVRNVLAGGASSGGLLVLILGVMSMTGEYRHQTATQTFLASPVRGRVLAAKLASCSLVGLAVALVAGALTLAMALPWLAGKGADVRMLEDVGVVLAGTTVCTVLYGGLGVAVGALIRNQTTAIVLSMFWVVVLEAVFVAMLPAIGRWLPGGAASALTSSSVQAGDLLPMWAAALVLAAYAVGFAVTGNRAVIGRDVT